MKMWFVVLMMLSLNILIGCKKDAGINTLAITKPSDPSFIKSYFLDSPMSDIRKKYQGNVQNYSCNKEDSKACKDKGIKCVCYDVVLARTQFYAQDLYLTVVDEKIVGTFQATNAGTRFFSRFETAQDVFGDEAPSKIYEEKGHSYGYKTVALIWDIKDGHVFALAHCPLSNSAGRKETYLDNVRNCRVQKTSMNRLRKFVKADWMLDSSLKY